MSTTAFVSSLIESALLAPSPDNNQPWLFRPSADQIEVCLDPSRALLSDVESMFDLTAIGAAIENMAITSRQAGFELSVEYVAGGVQNASDKSPRTAAKLRWGAATAKDALAEHLASRHTCRKPYSTRPIKSGLLQTMQGEASRFDGVQVHWLEDRQSIRRFAWLIGMSDRLRFERETFHRELVNQLRFTAKDADASRDGLDLRTLELPPLGSSLLRLISNWRALQFLNWFGASRCLALPSVMSTMCSGAIGIITVSVPDSSSWITGGRAFQRLWIAANAAQLRLHPLGSLPIFLAHWRQWRGEQLSAGQRKLAAEMERRFSALVPAAQGRALQIAFRIGYGSEPTARSQRRSLEEVVG